MCDRIQSVLNVSKMTARKALRMCNNDAEQAIMLIMESDNMSDIEDDRESEPSDVSIGSVDTNWEHSSEMTDDDDDEFERAYETFRKADVTFDEEAFLPTIHEQLAVEQHCDKLQTDVLNFVVRQSKSRSEDAYPHLLRRVRRLNFEERHLTRALRYIRDEAPIIIHINLDQGNRLKMLSIDTHYRNQFETGTSNGTLDHHTRQGWESRLFNKLYDGVEGFQRPKYGCLNVVRDPKGIASASQYGDSYLVLKGVRLRCSFADQDSSSDNCELACCEWYAHVLNQFGKRELLAILEVANGKIPFKPSSCIVTYKEVQVHGEISLRENVDHIVVAARHKKQPQVLQHISTFCSTHDVNYYFADELQSTIKPLPEQGDFVIR
eukprot:TRINITY_DN17077_c0_g1_i1.p1 TRINITY_DN17077_c0_g1~~TRINITY_DN17077_c0_g1_i1.p1  ORF type:complete len:379 (+),score=63.16 TRINITY_DN17077_c0_g1_i1:60-1196(+)